MPGLVISISGDASGLGKGLDGAKSQVSAFGKSLDPTMLAMGAGIAGAAVIAGKALLDMGNAAAKDQQEQDRLTAAIVAATGSTADHTDEVNAAIAAGQDKAFTDTQSRDALMSLVTATHDVSKATALLTTAQDVARFAGVDLATAADAVAKAQAGQDTALTRMMPGLAKGKTSMDTLANATALAKGQADAYAKSGPGMADKTSDAMSELGETIGTAVLPVLEALMPALLAIIKAFGTIVTAILPILIPLMRALGAVISVVANAIAAALTFVARLVTALVHLMGPIRDVLNGIGSIHLPFGIGGQSAGGLGVSGLGVSATATSTTQVGGGVTFVINGAIDPEATARQIQRILASHATRTGRGAAV